MYKTVYDLSDDEIAELKDSFFWQDETQDVLEGAYTSSDQIPNDIIFEHYGMVRFVDEDFFCNAKKYRL